MRVLMFGWEFPPFISGGLGTACYGLVQGLMRNGVDVTFVLPTLRGRRPSEGPRILAADEVPFAERTLRMLAGVRQSLRIIPVMFERLFSPYVTRMVGEGRFSGEGAGWPWEGLEEEGRTTLLGFTGHYGRDLMQEVLRYGLVGAQLGLTESFDVIHSHDWLTYPPGVAAKWVSGKPLVVHVHATEFDRSGEHMNTEVYNIERFGYTHADRIVAVSHYTKNVLTSRYGVPPSKIEVVHNAVGKETHLARFGVRKPFGEKLVLFLGRVTMQKGPEYFLEAAAIVRRAMRRKVRFVMAGSGDMLTRMIARQARLRLGDCFHFTGFLRGLDVERIYAMSDLFVMPSVSEPFGIAAFEALLYDVPVILSKQSGVSELLPEAPTVDFWDVRKLAAMMERYLKDEKAARATVAACKGRLEAVGWDHAGRRLAEIYRSLTGRG